MSHTVLHSKSYSLLDQKLHSKLCENYVKFKLTKRVNEVKLKEKLRSHCYDGYIIILS